jgi:hypothetical protein
LVRPIPFDTGRGGRRPVAERRVWPPCVVFHSPLLDHDLRLLQRVKDFPIQALIPQLPVEALAVTVLPWTARFDVHHSGPHVRQPFPQFPGHELRAVVRPNVLWNSSLQHHIRQCLDDLVASQSPRHSNRQALPHVFVDHRQHADRSAIVGYRTHEVIAPDVIRQLGP